MKLIGREKEIEQIRKTLGMGRHLLVEGPVGVGKTFLIQSALKKLKREFERVDGDTRYTEQKMTGWFDPPLVLKKGYSAACFIDGPLLKAMKQGQALFINELNRMPEAVQNILLPAMDEGQIALPKLKEVKAKKGFVVVATQNPKEFTATHALSEALLDRFEMIRLDYQSRDEEIAIVEQCVPGVKAAPMVDLVRRTRGHESIKRGASIRAAIAVAQMVKGGMDFVDALLLALPTRLELVSNEIDPKELLIELLEETVPSKKKRSESHASFS